MSPICHASHDSTAGRVSNPPFVRSSKARRTARPFGAGLALAILLLSGCLHPSAVDSARVGPFYTPVNVQAEPQLPANIRRVVLLPLAGGSIANAESTAALQPVIVAELQKQNRFEIVTLTRDELLQRYRATEIPSTAALPHDFMERIRAEFAADAVMFVDLTVYKPYRPISLGVRAKLATVEDVRLLWSFDNVFSADNPAVANSARRHFIDADRGKIPADLTPAVLQSPTQFAGYVAAAMFATLPPVYTPPPPPRGGKSSQAGE